MTEIPHEQPGQFRRESLASRLIQRIDIDLPSAIDDLAREAQFIRDGDRPGPTATEAEQAEIDKRLEEIEQEELFLVVLAGLMHYHRKDA